MKNEQKLWNKLKTLLKPLNDNNYTARIIYDYITRRFTSTATGRFIDVSKEPTELKLKLEAMCLEYANMESKNNEKSAQLLFDIRELTNALHAINGNCISIKEASFLLERFWQRTSDACPLECTAAENEEKNFKNWVKSTYTH